MNPSYKKSTQYAARIGGVGRRGVEVDPSTSVGPRTWLRSPRNFAKTRFRRSPSIQFSAKQKKIGEIVRSRKSFYAFEVQFWRIYGDTDLNGDFLAFVRSRCTYYELCTTKNRRKYIRRRSGIMFGVSRRDSSIGL